VARYGKSFKARAVARLLPPESASAQQVAQDIGIGIATLERWASDARVVAGHGRCWSASTRLDAVIATASMNAVDCSAWCREHGVFPAELDTWRASAVAALAEPGATRSPMTRADGQDRQRIKELERDLSRKNRALAETAALLVLSKKVAAIFNKAEDE
jgi:transposase